MTCQGFEQRLDEFVGGTVSPEVLREVERHLTGCRRCRRLADIVRGDLDLAPPGTDPGLTKAVLRRTSGPACAAAEGRLVALVDGALADSAMASGALAGGDEELVRLHIGHCTACRALAETLTWMQRELPAMAEIDPGPEFVRRVVSVTTLRERRVAGRATADRLAALRDWATGLVQRPRFALEAAFGGALILWLLLGTPVSPLRAAPARALDVVRVNPVRAIEASARVIPDWLERRASTTRRMWDEADGAVRVRARATRTDWDRRLRAAGEPGRAFRAHGRALIEATGQGDFDACAGHLRGMYAGLESILNELSKPDIAESSASQEV